MGRAAFLLILSVATEIVQAPPDLGGKYAAPFGISTKYLTTGSTALTGVETLKFTTQSFTQFGLYWGSIDGYNNISFFRNGQLVTGASFDGSFPGIANPANGNQTSTDTNRYVTFSFTGGNSFDTVQFTSTSAAFEVDDLTASNFSMTDPVPEPSTWAMMILGFFGVGFMAYRRREPPIRHFASSKN